MRHKSEAFTVWLPLSVGVIGGNVECYWLTFIALGVLVVYHFPFPTLKQIACNCVPVLLGGLANLLVICFGLQWAIYKTLQEAITKRDAALGK